VSRLAGLPPGLVRYRRTPVFSEETIPAGLRREHRTKPGVWALISVLEGALRFRALTPCSEPQAPRHLSAGERIVVAPEQSHEVETEGPVRFFVEFYRAAETNGAEP
jgi:tellurite methyltransferase